jgi:hypothetical protein
MAKAFMDTVFAMQEMTIEDFESLEKEMERSKNNFTIRDLIAMKYMRKMIHFVKLLLD